MVWWVWSVVVDAEVPVKIMVGQLACLFVEGREVIAEKGIRIKMCQCTKPT
jgi:hypothetical protein